MESVVDHQTLYRALEQVFDPCSVLNGTPLNVVEMGLIREVAHERESVRVCLLLTDPFCPYFLELMHRVERALTALPGVQHVRFEASDDMLWTPERLAAAARERLAQHRVGRFAQLQAKPLTPQGNSLNNALVSGQPFEGLRPMPPIQYGRNLSRCSTCARSIVALPDEG